MADRLDLPLELSSAAASAWAHPNDTLHKAVRVLQYAYPIVLLFFFLAAFTARSILSSNSNTNIAKTTQTGPGGKPLPATDPTRNFVKRKVGDDVTQSQKRVFEWLSLTAALTFVANAINVIVHALIKRKEHWWCGQHTVVCISPHPQLPTALNACLCGAPRLTHA